MSDYKPPRKVSARWENATRVPYNPFRSFWGLQEQEILCPNCNVQLFVRESVFDYFTIERRTAPLQTGYAERMFAHTCEHCSFAINRSKLAVAKFARDFVMDPTNTRDIEKYGDAIYLPYVVPCTPFEVIKDRDFSVEHFLLIRGR